MLTTLRRPADFWWLVEGLPLLKYLNGGLMCATRMLAHGSRCARLYGASRIDFGIDVHYLRWLAEHFRPPSGLEAGRFREPIRVWPSGARQRNS